MNAAVELDPRHAAVRKSIDEYRDRLLDLTGRNPLISFKHDAKGRLLVRAIDGYIGHLFDQLQDDKPIVVRSLPPLLGEPLAGHHPPGLHPPGPPPLGLPPPEPPETGADAKTPAPATIDLEAHARSVGIDPSFDLRPPAALADAPAPPPQRPAGHMQTRLLPDDLQRVLAKLRDTARTTIEESGASTLYLAFGFLEWFDSESSEAALTSPLILLPVEIERRIAASRYEYSLKAGDNDADVNLTLALRLEKDFRIKLPSLAADQGPQDYLERVRREVCVGRARWAVRSFVTLAHFPFARLAMYQDLDAAKWSGRLLVHPVLGALLGGTEAAEAMFAEEHDVDSPEVTAKVPRLVMDADASQYSAVHDVMSGRNLVIEGPPGTGKSQTITNIIATALGDGKRVLFMAEKQAALQVVKDRLDSVGLGDFCLELHSGKARKRDVLDSLKRRIERRASKAKLSALDAALRELAATRAALTRYVELLNTGFGRAGLTLHDILWADRRRRDTDPAEGGALDAVALPDCEALTEADLQAHRAVLSRFEQAAAPILARHASPAAHPWCGMTRTDLSAVDVEQAARQTQQAADGMAAVDRGARQMQAAALDPGAPLDALWPIVEAVAGLTVPADIPAPWLPALADAEMARMATDWLAACARYRESLAVQAALLARPADTAPEHAAAALSAAWSALEPAAEVGITVAALPGWAASRRDAARRLGEAAEASSAIASALGLTVTTLADIADLVAAIALAAEAPPAVVDDDAPELLREGNAASLSAASTVIGEARTRAADIAAAFSIPPSADAASLRRHAGALATASPLHVFSRAVRDARQAHAALCRKPTRGGNADMAADLVRIAESLEATSRLACDATLRGTFGAAYRGIETDLEAAFAAAGWAGRVRRVIKPRHGVADMLAGWLLSGESARVRALRSLATSPAYATLQACLNQQAPSAASLHDLAAAQATWAELAEELHACCLEVGVPPATRCETLPRIGLALHATAEARSAAQAPSRLAAAFGPGLPAPDTDQASLAAALRLATTIAALPVPAAMRAALWRTPPETLRTTIIPGMAALQAALAEASDHWGALETRLGLDEAALFGCAIGSTSAGTVATRLAHAAAHPSALGEWLTYLLQRRAVEQRGLAPLLRLWDARPGALSLVPALDRVFHHALARAAFRKHPELNQFNGLEQQAARHRFKLLDAEATALHRQCLAEQVGQRPVPGGIGVGRRSEFTDQALILAEISKQKRHIPLRQLLRRAGAAVQALKPCFMMSPLSVAQFLEPSGPDFDLLVIDEASQMRPEDAVGAVARCGQIVVVGDPKQLPPSAFFDRKAADADDEDAADIDDAESILDKAQAVFRPMRRLRWHYRSRHGSLVAFSNQEFYDNDLIVFPSPAEAGEAQGVRLTPVGGLYKSRRNVIEMQAVCAAALEHMRAAPHRSLGIATMNRPQCDLIAEEMDRLATLHPEIEAYRERWAQGLESFFVKNLENVQGDERDVIFVSTVFGPATPGGKPHQRFGINGASGHRRLNVLFTRAKHHLRLFSSMSADDIIVGPDSPRGVQVLRKFLAYAETGRLEAGLLSNREPDSDFEIFVRDRLARAGFEVVPQVGVAGYFIDLAVRDPACPAHFLLGIECDGATYHSSKSARDRDILRQQILEGLGWTIYRIWSTDWFRDPAGETAKVIAFIQQCRAARPTTPMTPPPPSASAAR